MRVVTWNSRGKGVANWAALEQLQADVAMLQETTLANPQPAATLTSQAATWVSAGKIPARSVAIGSSTMALQPLAARPGQGRWTAAARLATGTTVLSIWSCPEKAGGWHYSDEVVATLDAWAEVITDGDVIIGGDFNIGHAVGRQTANARLERARSRWEQLGLVSAYHRLTGENPAEPSDATYFHRGHRFEPWHIDYVLVPEVRTAGLRAVTLGGYDEWVGNGRSDHVPIVVDIDW